MTEPAAPALDGRRPLFAFAGGRSARFSMIFAALAFVGALLMPAIVAYDDQRARECFEKELAENPPTKVLGVTFGEREFVPPSEKSMPSGHALLAMIALIALGLAALLLGLDGALFGPSRQLAIFGAAGGPAAVFLAAMLTPWGLSLLIIAGAILAIAAAGFGFLAAASDGGVC